MTLWNRCQQTAKKLDDTDEDWYKDIDLNSLDMSDCNKCVIGQWVNGFLPSKEMHDLIVHSDMSAYALGFSGGWGIDNYYGKLKRYWTTLIRQRRERD